MLKAVHVDFNQMCRERIKRNLPGLEDLGLFLLHCGQAYGVRQEWVSVTAEQCQKGTLEHMGMLERLRKLEQISSNTQLLKILDKTQCKKTKQKKRWNTWNTLTQIHYC